MKTKRSGLTIIFILCVIGVVMCSFVPTDSLQYKNASDVSWVDSIAVALRGAHIVQTEDGIFVADNIPCFSSSSKLGLFVRFKDYIYIDCSTCEVTRGKANRNSMGYCTIIRKYDKFK